MEHTILTPTRTPPAPVAPEDGDTDFDFPVKVTVEAAGRAAPDTRAPRSIFDMAAIVESAKALKKQGRFGAASGFKAQPAQASPYPGAVAPAWAAVERVYGDGVTRSTGSKYPADRWTEEKQERERQRRARQRPPKPSKKAKRRSKKLLEAIGDDIWDE
jgi:hypothetical protein